MRGIILHCNNLYSKDIRKSTRPGNVVKPDFEEAEFGDSVVALVSIEAGDREEYAEKAAERIDVLNKEFYNNGKVVVCPFVHLTNRIEKPGRAKELLECIESSLKKRNYATSMVTFGTHKDFKIDIKGHAGSVSYFEFPFQKKPAPGVPSAGKFSWDPEIYSEFVEKLNKSLLRKQHADEMDVIQKTASPGKALIEVGAGYGRIVDASVGLYSKVVAVEKNERMYLHLAKRYKGNKKVRVLNGDAAHLREILPDVKKPVIACMQNTLGTIDGNWRDVVQEMAGVAKERKGEAVLSLFHKNALKGFGMRMYRLLEPMVGKYDSRQSSLDTGDFATIQGYRSHWWGKSERNEIRNIFKGAKQVIKSTDSYWILHAKY